MTTTILALALAFTTMGFDGSNAETKQSKTLDPDYVKIESMIKTGSTTEVVIQQRNGAQFCPVPTMKSEKDRVSDTEDKIVLDLVIYPAE